MPSSTSITTVYVTMLLDIVAFKRTCETCPVNFLFGNASTEKRAGWPLAIRAISASLMLAHSLRLFRIIADQKQRLISGYCGIGIDPPIENESIDGRYDCAACQIEFRKFQIGLTLCDDGSIGVQSAQCRFKVKPRWIRDRRRDAGSVCGAFV